MTEEALKKEDRIYASGGVVVSKRSTIPAVIKVGTILFRVSRDKIEWLQKCYDLKDGSKIGRTVVDETTIYIDPDLPEDLSKSVLWHEVLHALCAVVMGMPKWSSEAMGESDYDREEFVVSAWEHPTLSVLRDNPDLVAYLMSD